MNLASNSNPQNQSLPALATAYPRPSGNSNSLRPRTKSAKRVGYRKWNLPGTTEPLRPSCSASQNLQLRRPVPGLDRNAATCVEFQIAPGFPMRLKLTMAPSHNLFPASDPDQTAEYTRPQPGLASLSPRI